MNAITDQKALAPFRKSPGIALTIHEPRTDWVKVGKLGLQFLGGCSFVFLVVSVLWGAGQ